MPTTKSYLGRRLALYDQQLETWKRDHKRAMPIFDLEELYNDIINDIRRLFLRDAIVHEQAATEGNADLLKQWNTKCTRLIKDYIALVENFRLLYSSLRGHEYKDVKVDLKRLGESELRLRAALAPNDSYLERADVNQAIESAEDDYKHDRYDEEVA
jgi:hypothetical protein